MNDLLYFFPGAQGAVMGANQEAFYRERGLWPVLEGTLPASGGPAGPGGGRGVLVIPKAAHRQNVDARPIYDESAQTWEECHDGSYWIGYWNDRKPGPQDLARKVQIEGHRVELADGHSWLIPLVRQIDGMTHLPVVIKLAPDGQEIQAVHPKHKAFYDRVAAEWKTVTSDNGFERGYTELREIAEMALTVNYHVGRWEASVLGLFDTQNLWDIWDALIDMVALREMIEAQKKTALVGDT